MSGCTGNLDTCQHVTDLEAERDAALARVRELESANAAGQGRRVATCPEPACSPLHPCALCGRTEYPVEYSSDGKTPLPSGCVVVFDNGELVWICRRCSRDPAALERLETDDSLTANAPAHGRDERSVP